jgi:hypothetical protein
MPTIFFKILIHQTNKYIVSRKNPKQSILYKLSCFSSHRAIFEESHQQQKSVLKYVREVKLCTYSAKLCNTVNIRDGKYPTNISQG